MVERIVTLIAVDDVVLAQLEQLARNDAEADDVTPALGGGTSWNAQRLEWFRDYQRNARVGLAGPLKPSPGQFHRPLKARWAQSD